MKKRSFLKALGLTVLGTGSSSVMGKNIPNMMNVPYSEAANLPSIISTSTKGKVTKVLVEGHKEPCTMMHITDSHITFRVQTTKPFGSIASECIRHIKRRRIM